MTNSNNQSTKNGEVLFTEAPASWNTRYVDPDGFECQLTLRAETGQDLLEKVNAAITFLLENGCVPYSFRGVNRVKNSKGGNNKGNSKLDSQGWCPIHECEMTRWEKDGKSWFSHKAGESWCYGKEA